MSGQWVVQHAGAVGSPSLSVVKFDGNQGLALGSGSLVFTSNDQGQQWNRKTIGIAVNFFDFDFLGSNTLLAIGSQVLNLSNYRSRLLKSTDFGQTWSLIQDFEQQTLYGIHFTSAMTGFLTGFEGIYRTTDAGMDWDPVWDASDIGFQYGEISAISFPTAATGYAAGVGLDQDNFFKSFLIKSTDGGLNWSLVRIFEQSLVIPAIYFFDAQSGLLAVADDLTTTGNIYRTSDGGANWTVQEVPHFGTYALHFPDNQTGYLVNSGSLLNMGVQSPVFSISRTANGGSSWSDQYTNEPGVPLHSVFFTGQNTGFTVGDYELIMRTTTGGGPIQGDYPWDLMDSRELVREKLEGVSLFPVPADQWLHIRLDDPSLLGEELRVEICSLQGRVVRRETQAGLGISELFIGDLPRGIYLLQLQAGGRFGLFRFVKG